MLTYISYLIPTTTFLVEIIFALFLGIFVNISLILSGQRWAKNFTYSMTCCILPITSMVITKVISGNIALSLGMVGALSIVRFRHPVKSPLELALYFLLVTLGISVNSSPSSALTLAALSMTVLYIYAYYTSRSKGFHGFIPTLEIEGYSEAYLLELKSNSPIKDLTQYENLIYSFEDLSSKNNVYKLKFAQLIEANNFIKELEIYPSITERKISKI